MPFGGVLTDRARLVSCATLGAMTLATVCVIPKAAEKRHHRRVGRLRCLGSAHPGKPTLRRTIRSSAGI